jgi:hypothetical protein
VKNNDDKDQASKKEITQITSSSLKDLKMEYTLLAQRCTLDMTALYLPYPWEYNAVSDVPWI